MSFYLMEIGVEELPSSFINPASDFLKNKLQKLLKDKSIKHDSVYTAGTPRRLVLYIDGLAEKQEDREEKVVGPPANIAFDENNYLTKAGRGFVKSKSIPEENICVETTEKGKYLAGTIFHKGEKTFDFLKDNIANIIYSIPFQKSMRWSNKDIKFARPIHWVVSVFDNEILPFTIDGISSANVTYGHRFMGNSSCRITDFYSYRECMENKNVIIDFGERKKIIQNQLEHIQQTRDIEVNIDEELLDSVANLVEKPYAVVGKFSENFLELPEEVLITSMKNHQKYFYTTDQNGKMTNFFIGISNTEPMDDTIQFGYEKVLKARLADAVFFFENDKKKTLEQRVEELKDVIYQDKLGTSYEKMERFYKIASYLSGQLASVNLSSIQRVAYLSKGDLMTEMIYEFPELQGVMGREYASLQGESENVCKGIYEHYLPRFAEDKLPTGIEGSIVSIADKIDTICGCFAVGLIPTGNNDPYALRRNAIGILNIIRDNGFRLNFKRLVEYSLEVLENKVSFNMAEVKGNVFDFITLRLKNILASEGISGDIFDAINKYDDLLSLERVAKALDNVKDSEDFTIITNSYKRINNILKKSEGISNTYNSDMLTNDYEKVLDEMIKSTGEEIVELIGSESYKEAIEKLLSFSKPVDEFFDNVMVMDKNIEIKNNRLSLLNSLKNVFDTVADLSKIN